MFDRRSFLSRAAVAGALLPSQVEAFARADGAAALPSPPVSGGGDEAYWSRVRRLFLIPEGVVYLNNGTVGSSPIPVVNAVVNGLHETEKMMLPGSEDYPIWGYGPWREFREPLAAFLGTSVDQLALLRNATEANSFIANGLEMRPGDEVLISDEEHASGEQPWNLRAKRYGIVVKKFAMPTPPKSPADILNRINDSITARTKIIFVSHISTHSGVVLPAKEIAALARSKGILSAFDGAHVPGMMKVDIEDIGCDIYTGSLHKWLMAPKGCGFLHVREGVMDQIWNTIVTSGWNKPELKAERFMHIGTSNVPLLWGMRESIAFANRLGMDRIEQRHRRMADYLHQAMLARGAETLTSPDPSLRCAIATVNVPPIKRMELQDWLWKNHRIRIRGGEPSRLRLSTPYYLLKADIDRFLEKFDEFRAAHPA